MCKKIFYLMLLGLFFGLTSYAQYIQGKVSDAETGEPLEMVTVSLHRADSSLIAGNVSVPGGAIYLAPTDEKNVLVRATLIGYETLWMPLTNPLDIKLRPQSAQLKEAVVTGQRKLFQFEGKGIKANVQGTYLSKLPDIMMLLGQVPGLMVSGESVSTYFGVTPIVYLNGRKVKDMREVYMLDVSRVSSVELNLSPGAEYDSSAGAVLLIKTLGGRQDSFSGLFTAGGEYNFKWKSLKPMLDASLLYKRGKWSLRGDLTFQNYRAGTGSQEEILFEAWAATKEQRQVQDERWRSLLKLDFKGRESYLYTQLTADYDINDTDRWSFSYSPYFTIPSGWNGVITNTDFWYATPAENKDKLEKVSQIKSLNAIKQPEAAHYIKTSYMGKLSEQLRMELYLDYLYKQTENDQRSHEEEEYFLPTLGRTTLELGNKMKSRSHFVGVEPRFNWQLGQSLLSFGAEGSYIENNVDARYDQNISGLLFSNTHNRIRELRGAAYATYSFGLFKTLRLELGLRAEYNNYQLYDLIGEKSLREADQFSLSPNVQLSQSIGEFYHNISYRRSIRDPQFYALAGNNIYVNRTMAMKSNIGLERSIAHNINYNAGWRFLSLQLGYERIYRNMDQLFIRDWPKVDATAPLVERAPKLSVAWTNVDRREQLYLALTAFGRWPSYQPSLTVVPVYLSQKAQEVFGYNIDQKSLGLKIVTTHNFILEGGWNINLMYTYMSPMKYGLYEAPASHYQQVSINKSFLDGRLQLILSAMDPLGLAHNNIDVNHTDMIFRGRTLGSNLRSITLQAKYRFNQYKSRKETGSAAQEQRSRL